MKENIFFILENNLYLFIILCLVNLFLIKSDILSKILKYIPRINFSSIKSLFNLKNTFINIGVYIVIIIISLLCGFTAVLFGLSNYNLINIFTNQCLVDNCNMNCDESKKEIPFYIGFGIVYLILSVIFIIITSIINKKINLSSIILTIIVGILVGISAILINKKNDDTDNKVKKSISYRYLFTFNDFYNIYYIITIFKRNI